MTNPNHPWLDAISAQEGDPDPRVVDAVPAGVIIQETNDGPEVVVGRQFTVVFNGNVQRLDGNPHKYKTAFGKVASIQVGNALTEADETARQRDIAVEALFRALTTLEGIVRTDSVCMSEVRERVMSCRTALKACGVSE